MGPAGAPARPPYANFSKAGVGPRTPGAYTVMGPAGGPMRPPYGAFSGRAPLPRAGRFTIMGPVGAPMRPPYGSFLNKPPSGVIPPPTPTTGGGEPAPRRPRYSWKWSDFTDREWFRAFREEFYRLKRLKSPERRRAQFEALEQAFVRAVERALGAETATEITLDLMTAGQLLQVAAGIGSESSDRIEMYLVALAAEIDDEEAFLLLDS